MAIKFPERTVPPKQERYQRRFYVDARVDPTDAATPDPIFYLLGEDNDDLTRDISWSNEQTRNVLGVTRSTSTVDGETVSAEPFYAREGDDMALLLQHFDMTKAELDSIKRTYYEAKIDNNGDTIYAFRQVADIMLQSVGGPADNADNLPFEIALSGPKVEMEYDMATETFTEIP